MPRAGDVLKDLEESLEEINKEIEEEKRLQEEEPVSDPEDELKGFILPAAAGVVGTVEGVRGEELTGAGGAVKAAIEKVAEAPMRPVKKKEKVAGGRAGDVLKELEARREFVQKNVNDMYEVQQARGQLMKAFNILMPVAQTLTIRPIIMELAPREVIRGMAASGELGLDPELVNQILELPDSDIRIYPGREDYNTWLGTWTAKYPKASGFLGAQKMSQKLQEQYDAPLVIEITTDKEIETKVKKGIPREKIKGRTTEIIPIDVTPRQIAAMLDVPDSDTGITMRESILQESLTASLAYLSTREMWVQKRGIEGRTESAETTFIEWSKLAVPPGHRGAKLHRATAFALDILTPEPSDVVGELKPVKHVLSLFGQTKLGAAFLTTADNVTLSRWVMNWLDLMPEVSKKTKSTYLGTKAVLTSHKGDMKKLYQRFHELMVEDAKKLGKKFDALYDRKMYSNFQKWLKDGYGGEEIAGHVYLRDWLNSGHTLDDFFEDTTNLARILKTDPDKLGKHLTFTDQRSFIKAWEGNYFQTVRAYDTRKALENESLRVFGKSNDPTRMGYVFRDGTALDLGMYDHKKVSRLAGINPDDPVLDYLEKTGAMRMQADRVGDMNEITVKLTEDLTDEQVNEIAKQVQRLRKDKDTPLRLIFESPNDELKLGLPGEKSVSGGQFWKILDPTVEEVFKFFKGHTVVDTVPNKAYAGMFLALDDLVKANEAMKLEIGTITQEAVDVKKKAGQKYFPHGVAEQKSKRQVAFSTTNQQAAAKHKRTHGLMTEADDSFEKAVLLSGDVPEYGMLLGLIRDSEDTYTDMMQTFIEKSLLEQRVLRNIVGMRPLGEKELDRAWEIVQENQKYLRGVTITNDNVVEWANKTMSSVNVNRVFDKLDAGEQTIEMINPQKLDLSVLGGKDRKITQQQYGVYFPISRLKITRRNIAREIERNMAKAAKSPEEMAKLQTELAGVLDEMGSITRKTQKDISQADLQRFMQLMESGVVQEFAPESVLTVSKDVPMYITTRDVATFIRSEVRTVSDPEAMKALRFIHKIQRPFMGIVTTWNPAFWKKYLMTDVFQLWKGGVPLYEIPGRIAQGGLALTGKGRIKIAGFAFDNREYLKHVEKTGVRRHVRELLSGSRHDILQRYVQDVIATGNVGRALKQPNRFVQSALTNIDDATRIGLFSHRLEYLAHASGAASKADVIKLMPEAAEWTWKHMFNYDDMPAFLKRMRALFPFLSWQYHILPDMLRLGLDVKKMKQFAKGQLAMQSLIGRPNIPMEKEYTKRSPELMWEPSPGTALRLVTNLPLYETLNFESLEGVINSMVPMVNPYLQLPLMMAGVQTFPKIGPYKEYQRVAMPIGMFMFYKNAKLLNSEVFQKYSQLSVEFHRDADDLETAAWLTVSKQFSDVFETAFTFTRGLDANTRNIKLFVDLEDLKAQVFEQASDIDTMTPEQVETSVQELQIKKVPYLKFHRTRPGIATQEIDIYAHFKRQLNLVESLAGQVESSLGGLLQPGDRWESLQMTPPANTKRDYMALLTLYHELLDSLADDPHLEDKVTRELGSRVEALQEAGEDFLHVIDYVR